MRKFAAPTSRAFLVLIGFHLSALSVVKLDVCKEKKKNPSPSSAPTPPPFPLLWLQAPVRYLSKFIPAPAGSRSGGVCEKRQPTAHSPDCWRIFCILCLGIRSFGPLRVCHDPCPGLQAQVASETRWCFDSFVGLQGVIRMICPS